MTTITVTVDEDIVRAARERAEAEHTTLDDQIYRWLQDYVREKRRRDADEAMAVLKDLQTRVSTAGQKFTREELNERRPS